MNEFSSRQFLLDHTAAILGFYEPIVFDRSGGFYQNFRDDGTVFDTHSRHLVSSTRFVFNYSRPSAVDWEVTIRPGPNTALIIC